MNDKKHTPGPWEASPDWAHDRMEIRDKDGRRAENQRLRQIIRALLRDTNGQEVAAVEEGQTCELLQ